MLVQLNQVGILFAVEGKFAVGTFNDTLITETVMCYEFLEKLPTVHAEAVLCKSCSAKILIEFCLKHEIKVILNTLL